MAAPPPKIGAADLRRMSSRLNETRILADQAGDDVRPAIEARAAPLTDAERATAAVVVALADVDAAELGRYLRRVKLAGLAEFASIAAPGRPASASPPPRPASASPPPRPPTRPASAARRGATAGRARGRGRGRPREDRDGEPAPGPPPGLTAGEMAALLVELDAFTPGAGEDGARDPEREEPAAPKRGGPKGPREARGARGLSAPARAAAAEALDAVPADDIGDF